MNAKILMLAGALLACLMPVPSAAGPVTDIAKEADALLEEGDAVAALNRLSEATEILWDAAPLHIRKQLFVESATGFGLYVARERGSSFKQGESILIYAEPVGYGYGRDGLGNLAIGFEVDFELVSLEGETLLKKDNFVQIGSPLRYKNREFFLSLTVNLNGVPVGDYVSKFRLRDQYSDKSVFFELPFSFTE